MINVYNNNPNWQISHYCIYVYYSSAIMSQENIYADLHVHQVYEDDKQIYTALNQLPPADGSSDNSKHVYHELHKPAGINQGTEGRCSSSDHEQQQTSLSINKKSQPVSKMVIFQSVVLLLILLLLGAILSLMFINMTVLDPVTAAAAVQVQQNELTSLLENITESVTSLQHLLNKQIQNNISQSTTDFLQDATANQTFSILENITNIIVTHLDSLANQQLVYIQNSTDTVNLIRENTTQELSNIADTLDILKNTSTFITQGVTNIQQIGIFSLLETTQNITDIVTYLRTIADEHNNFIKLSSTNSTQVLSNIVDTLNFSIFEALENITNVVMYLHSFADQRLEYQNNTDTVNLIRESTENITQKLSNIADILDILQDTSGSTANQTFALFEAIQNVTTFLDSFADQQLMSYTQINTNTVNLIKQSSENTTQKLINIVSTLNNLKGTSTSTAGVVDDILLVVEELLEIQNASVLFNSIRPVSCKDIKTVLPNSPTGYYHINSHNIYCNMGELCGTGGGWTRLAYLDMSDSTVNCPTGFRLYQSGGVRSCGRPVSSCGGCSSVQYPSNGISYSQICGRVVGYRYGSTDAVDTVYGNISDINSYYVDGVSITHGSPRQHVWTLMAGLQHDASNNCPCNTTLDDTFSFIESNYFCESGNPNNTWTNTLYTGDPLWDGQGCDGLEAPCCSVPGLPWFHRDYGNITTTDYIELRVCADESTDNEDVPVSFYEIYVK